MTSPGQGGISASYAGITRRALHLAQTSHSCSKAFKDREGRGQGPRGQYPCPEQLVGSDSQRPPVHSEGVAYGLGGVKHLWCCEGRKRES